MSMIALPRPGFWITDLAVVLCGDDKFVSVLHHILIGALITNCTSTSELFGSCSWNPPFSHFKLQILFDVPAKNNDDLVFPYLTRHSVEHVTRLGTIMYFSSFFRECRLYDTDERYLHIISRYVLVPAPASSIKLPKVLSGLPQLFCWFSLLGSLTLLPPYLGFCANECAKCFKINFLT